MRNCKILPMNKVSFQVKISSGEVQIFCVITLIFYISRKTIVYLYTHIVPPSLKLFKLAEG